MAPSFMQRFFARKKPDNDVISLGLAERLKSRVAPGPPLDVAGDQENRTHLEHGSAAANSTSAASNVNSLFAFVDPKDPFTPGEIAGEQLPGPILSIMSAKQFRHLFLFHTPHTRQHAVATEKEVSSRYPECQIIVNELPISDPKNYSSVMGRLARTVRRLMKLGSSEIADCYVCVSSGTAEMRAAWFLLAALGVLPAKMLQVGSPARPLFGEANVKEVRMDAGDWLTIRELAMPDEYFRIAAMEGFTKSSPPPTAVGRGRGPSWPHRGTKKSEERPKSGQVLFGFNETFVDRMRKQYGDALSDFLLLRLSEKLQQNTLFSQLFSVDEVQDFARDVFEKFAAGLRQKGGTDKPELFGALANSVCDDVLLDY